MQHALENQINNYLMSLPDYSDNTFKFRISMAGDCIRLMDYNNQQGRRPFGIDQALRLHTGTYLHRMWQDIMLGAFGSDFVEPESQVEIDCGEFKVEGHPDGILKSLNAIWEFKTVSDHSFEMVKNAGTAMSQHYEQGNLYAHAKGLSSILFHYFNKNTSESLFLMAPYSKELAEHSISKMKKVYENKKTGVMSDRPYTDPTNSPCWYCPYKDDCYKDYKTEIAGMASVALPKEHEKELYDSVSGYWLLRSNRLAAEKGEAKLRELIVDRLVKRGLNNVSIGTFTIDIKVGKNNNPICNIKNKE